MKRQGVRLCGWSVILLLTAGCTSGGMASQAHGVLYGFAGDFLRQALAALLL